MNIDTLTFVITLKGSRPSPSDDSLHHYEIYIDNEMIISKDIKDINFVNEFSERIDSKLKFGDHTLKIKYRGRGSLKLENVYVNNTNKGSGMNCDSILTTESSVVYKDKVVNNTTLIKQHGKYVLNFNSPFFYWALSIFPI
jgi:hypothetical protein